jgi:hypothetical protein
MPPATPSATHHQARNAMRSNRARFHLIALHSNARRSQPPWEDSCHRPAGRTCPRGRRSGLSDRRRALPRRPVRTLVHPAARSRTGVQHSCQPVHQLRQCPSTTTSSMTCQPPWRRAAALLAKAQKSEDHSDDHDQTYDVDDGVHGPLPEMQPWNERHAGSKALNVPGWSWWSSPPGRPEPPLWWSAVSSWRASAARHART